MLPRRRTGRHLSAAPGQAAGDPVDGDLQVVHFSVVVRRRQVVRAEAAEQQGQEEVQQLEGPHTHARSEVRGQSGKNREYRT